MLSAERVQLNANVSALSTISARLALLSALTNSLTIGADVADAVQGCGDGAHVNLLWLKFFVEQKSQIFPVLFAPPRWDCSLRGLWIASLGCLLVGPALLSESRCRSSSTRLSGRRAECVGAVTRFEPTLLSHSVS